MKSIVVVFIFTVAALCQTTVTHEDGTRTTASCNKSGDCVVYDPDFVKQVGKTEQTQANWCHTNHIKKGAACVNAWQNGFRGKLPVCGPEHRSGDLSASCWETVSK